jgi:hypothetical protein
MIIAREYLCFAACVQIAAKETAGVDVDQTFIANQLGVVVPPEFASVGLVEAGITNAHRDSDPSKWGIDPRLEEVNRVLRSTMPPLQCLFEAISTFQDWEFEQRLAKAKRSGQFPIVGFHYNSLFGDLVQGDQGHCAVVYGLTETGRSIVELYDPGPSRSGFVSVDTNDLYRACRRKHGGIWLIGGASRGRFPP